MKIALIRREYITHVDGVNRVIALLADAFTKLGHDVTVLSWSYYGVRRDELPRWFREIHGIDVEPRIETLREPRKESWPRIALDWWLRGSAALKGHDVAIINGILPLRFRPIVAVNHGLTLGGKWLYRKVAAYFYNRADRVVCVSNRLVGELGGLGVRCDVVIPPPLKLDLFKPSSDRENVVVHIGGRPVKNPEISVKAVEMLNKKGLHVKLYVIGREGRDTEHVKWLGTVDERTRINLLCRAKALIHPSSYESFSLAVAEAMACGTPPIVSPAVPEELAVDGYNAIRVTTYNPEDYAEALHKLLTDDKLWTALSQSGVATAKELDHVKIAEKYTSILKSVTATRHG